MARFSASTALIRFREAIIGALAICCANWQMPQAPKGGTDSAQDMGELAELRQRELA
jgi:hypothetical protein